MHALKPTVLPLAALLLAAGWAGAAPPARIADCPRYDGVVTMTGRGFPQPTTCLYDEHGDVRAAIVRYEATLETPAVRAQIDRLLPQAAPERLPAPVPARTSATTSPPPLRANEQVLVRYVYDALGRVRSKIGDEGVRHYVYDGDSRRVLEELDDQGRTVASFVWKASGWSASRGPASARATPSSTAWARWSGSPTTGARSRRRTTTTPGANIASQVH